MREKKWKVPSCINKMRVPCRKVFHMSALARLSIKL